MEKHILITQEIIDQYGRINGDNDIIHYDDEYAKKRGFRGTLAHGLMVQGYANDVAAQKYGRDWFYRGVIEVKFVGPTCPGDDLVVSIADDGALEAKAEAGMTVVGKVSLRPA